jgi:PIN domain nuclease of toxin-antitoxin system
MKILLDTHTFIWWDSLPEKLSKKALSLCQNQSNDLVISAATIWEIQIKKQLDKIKLDIPLKKMIEEQQKSNQLIILPINETHVLTLDDLPNLHKDPFDRIIIAQAKVEKITIISNDTIMKKYPVKVVW